MRLNQTLLLHLSLATLSLAISPRKPLSKRHVGLFRRDICTNNNEVDCESSCMPAGSVCCNDGSSTYCNAGSLCIPNACCPVGSTCTGSGGTQTLTVLTATGANPGGGQTATPIVVPVAPSTAGAQAPTTPVAQNTPVVQTTPLAHAPTNTLTNTLTNAVTQKSTNTLVVGSSTTATHSKAPPGSSTGSPAAGADSAGRVYGPQFSALAIVVLGHCLLMHMTNIGSVS
jgi:hypothetical protein